MVRRIKATAAAENSAEADFLAQVAALARRGLTQKQIAAELGLSTTTTLLARMVRASQATGKPVPTIGRRTKSPAGPRPVEMVTVAKRGKGAAFGVNIPAEPLRRAGFQVGDQLHVSVRGGKVTLRK